MKKNKMSFVLMGNKAYILAIIKYWMEIEKETEKRHVRVARVYRWRIRGYSPRISLTA